MNESLEQFFHPTLFYYLVLGMTPFALITALILLGMLFIKFWHTVSGGISSTALPLCSTAHVLLLVLSHVLEVWMFNRVEIWGLCRQVDCIDIVIRKPPCSLVQGVLWVIDLLKILYCWPFFTSSPKISQYCHASIFF
jgi:hypothetical protein